MKTFLNVLYRRILYKIPLKFLLILLAIFAVFIASVKADNITLYDGLDNTYNSTNAFVNPMYNTNTDDIYLLCIDNRSNSELTVWYNAHKVLVHTVGNYPPLCLGVDKNIQDISVISSSQTYTVYNITYMKTSDFTSLNCQTEYNLIPISSVDQNYCTTNNLCPTCQVCPSGSGSISTLYINDILHVGSPFIYMNIPEEIGRDYAYTQGGTNMFIDVEGYNVDYEAVQDIIDQQNYKPTQEDFQNIIALLGPYGEIIIFFVFLFIVWAWIKKPFKSKL